MAPVLMAPRVVLATGLGVGASLSIHPASPFSLTSSPLQCQAPPSHEPQPSAPSRRTHRSKWLAPRKMRQISLGSVLGLVAGLGLRAVSTVLAVSLGIGIVLVEVYIFLDVVNCEWRPG